MNIALSPAIRSVRAHANGRDAMLFNAWHKLTVLCKECTIANERAIPDPNVTSILFDVFPLYQLLPKLM